MFVQEIGLLASVRDSCIGMSIGFSERRGEAGWGEVYDLRRGWERSGYVLLGGGKRESCLIWNVNLGFVCEHCS